MGGMQLVRSCDIDRFHLCVGAKLVDGGISPAPEIRREPLACLGPRVRAGDEAHTRVAGERRRHQAEGASEAGGAEGDCLHPGTRILCLAEYLGA